jgi:hypothetical protein
VPTESVRKLPLKSLRFLDWLFHPPAFRLKEITVDEFNAKTSFHSETAGAARSGSLPQHIFEVVYDESPSSSTSGAGSCRAHTSTSCRPRRLLYSLEPHTLAAAFALEALQRYQSVAQKHGTVVGYFSQPPVVRSSWMPVRLIPFCVDPNHHTGTMLRRSRTFTPYCGTGLTPSTPSRASLARVRPRLSANDHCALDSPPHTHVTGIYLSTDASVCMSFWTSAPSWERSAIGPRVGLIAGCEVSALFLSAILPIVDTCQWP